MFELVDGFNQIWVCLLLILYVHVTPKISYITLSPKGTILFLQCFISPYTNIQLLIKSFAMALSHFSQWQF